MAAKKPRSKSRSKSRLTKAQAAQVRVIKAKGYSAAYEKRLVSAVKKGKTRQQARGHKPGEARQRREYQREQNEGLTTPQIESIARFYGKFNPPPYSKDEPELEELVDWTRENGFARFTEYRKTWEQQRRIYLRELAAGTHRDQPGMLDILNDVAEVPDTKWLFYH